MTEQDCNPLEARSVTELAAALEDGTRTKFLFFWGHESRTPGVGAHCLSQWYPSAFRDVSGRAFGSAEHYMMWRKAELFGDAAAANAILSARTPGEAKALGRQVEHFREEVWVEHRWEVVVTGSLLKFGSVPELTSYLLGTRNRVLAEASPLDLVWGIGLETSSEFAQQPDRWPGLNLLGFGLMEARSRLGGPDPGL